VNGVTPVTPSCARIFFSIWGSGVKVPSWLSTTACAFMPMIFAFRSSSKPLITARVTLRAPTPRTTPVIVIRVMNETKTELRFETR